MRNTLQNYCKRVNSDCITCLWSSAAKCVLGDDKYLLCGAVYLKPESTKYSDINIFDDFEGYLSHFNATNSFYLYK